MRCGVLPGAKSERLSPVPPGKRHGRDARRRNLSSIQALGLYLLLSIAPWDLCGCSGHEESSRVGSRSDRDTTARGSSQEPAPQSAGTCGTTEGRFPDPSPAPQLRGVARAPVPDATEEPETTEFKDEHGRKVRLPKALWIAIEDAEFPVRGSWGSPRATPGGLPVKAAYEGQTFKGHLWIVTFYRFSKAEVGFDVAALYEMRDGRSTQAVGNTTWGKFQFVTGRFSEP
jgi:hypothetical protein